MGVRRFESSPIRKGFCHERIEQKAVIAEEDVQQAACTFVKAYVKLNLKRRLNVWEAYA